MSGRSLCSGLVIGVSTPSSPRALESFRPILMNAIPRRINKTPEPKKARSQTR